MIVIKVNIATVNIVTIVMVMITSILNYMMLPKMKVDFFHFLEEVDPLWDEIEASSSAKIGSLEIGFMIF